MLVYAAGNTPAIEQLPVSGRRSTGQRPYGLGLSLAVPSVASLPGAAPGSVEHVTVWLGSAHAGSPHRTAGGGWCT